MGISHSFDFINLHYIISLFAVTILLFHIVLFLQSINFLIYKYSILNQGAPKLWRTVDKSLKVDAHKSQVGAGMGSCRRMPHQWWRNGNHFWDTRRQKWQQPHRCKTVWENSREEQKPMISNNIYATLVICTNYYILRNFELPLW